MLSFFVFMCIFFVCVLALDLYQVRQQLKETRDMFNKWTESTHWIMHGDLDKCIEDSADDFLNRYAENPAYKQCIGYKEVSLLKLYKTRCINCGEKIVWKRALNKMVPSWESTCSNCNHINHAIANPTVMIGAFAKIDLTSTIELTMKQG